MLNYPSLDHSTYRHSDDIETATFLLFRLQPRNLVYDFNDLNISKSLPSCTYNYHPDYLLSECSAVAEAIEYSYKCKLCIQQQLTDCLASALWIPFLLVSSHIQALLNICGSVREAFIFLDRELVSVPYPFHVELLGLKLKLISLII